MTRQRAVYGHTGCYYSGSRIENFELRGTFKER